jgi:hypothetical protein
MMKVGQRAGGNGCLHSRFGRCLKLNPGVVVIRKLTIKSVLFGGLVAIVLSAPAMALQDDDAAQQAGSTEASVRQQAMDYMQPFASQIGEWNVTNWLMSTPGAFDEKHFVVRVGWEFDGLGLRSDWYSVNDSGAAGRWFGVVIQTYNPASGEVEQEYFAGDRSTWIESRQVLELHDDGFGTTFSGADDYGPFDARTRTRYLETGGFDWTIERRYPGTDWFVIDRGEARAVAD